MKQPVFYYWYWRTSTICKIHNCETWNSAICHLYHCPTEERREKWFHPVYRFDSYWCWTVQPYGEYRQGTSYRRNPEHQKKETSDETANKTIWRNSKKDWRHGYTWKRGGKSRGECLKMARRGERRWVKQMLYRERYEDIPLKDGTMFYDPWDWD